MRAALLTLLLAYPAAHAQTTPATAPAGNLASPAVEVPLYDVVTVKPSQSLRDSSGYDANDSTLRAYNLTLKSLLEVAYNIRPDLIFGIPADLTSKRYDINAKILDPNFKVLEHLSDAQRRTQFLAILADRFHLQAHIETRTLPLFELTVMPGGPRFSHSPLKPDGTADRGTNIRNRSLEAKGVTLAEFAASLTNQLHRTVRDTTGLTGLYDFSLKWSLDDADPTTDPNSPLPLALEEQLGLKLKPSKGPVPTLVVDHIEAPTDN